MPKPIVCLSDALCQFLDAFRPCFSQRQWKYFVTVLLGLVECEGRSTLSGLLRCVGEQVSLSGLSRFLSRWSWLADEVAAVWHARFQDQMRPAVEAEHCRQRTQRPRRRGRPRGTVVTGYLIFDDSVHTKPRGRKMGGLGRHYSGTEKRVVRGHCLFSGLYILLDRRCPLEPQLYRQKAVCEREGVPFQSKVDMAVEAMEQFEPVAKTHTHVLVDSWYHCKRLRKTAQKRKWDISGGLKRNRKMRIIAEDGSRQSPSLAEYATTLGPRDWDEAIWPSWQGGHTVYVHAVRTWVRKLGPTLVLITRLNPDDPLEKARFWGTTLVNANAQSVTDIVAIRWDVEVLFEDYKDLLGSDDYQLLSATAIIRFWTLVSCLAYFLDECRARLQGPGDSHVTLGDARRSIQTDHQKNLLSCLEEQFRSGLAVEQVYARLNV